jgi:RNA polymerase sigma-70 factor (ECF subfamily)
MPEPWGRPCLDIDVAEVEFAACYQAEMPLLIRFLIKYGAAGHDAAEAAQEAFIELHRQWHSVSKPKPWLRKVAIRIYLKTPADNSLSLDGHDKPGVLDATNRIEFREEEKTVLAALGSLPPAQRAVLALHYDQFETREIAEILGMTEAAVAKTWREAGQP